MTIALINHPSCYLHDNGSVYHPELSTRLDAINDRLIASGLNQVLAHYDAPAATKQDLLRVHSAQHVERVFSLAPSSGNIDLDGDTSMNSHSLTAALHGAGAAMLGVDLVMNNQHRGVFCAIRPPGHHAGIHKPSGFCIFNNVAVGAAYAMQVYGLTRLAIVDFDVHHGDGTEEIFSKEPRVLFCSSFQHPYYPHKGANTVSDHILNLPLPAGTTGGDWREAIREQWLPKLEAFAPQLVMISAGFDSHLEDDMGGFKLVERDYAWITTELCRIAAIDGVGRIVSCLEGGYDNSSLGRSVAAHIKAMADYAP